MSIYKFKQTKTKNILSCSVYETEIHHINKILLRRQAHMSKGVQVVVGEFELLKRDELAAPVRPGGGRVWMNVEPPGHRGLCLSRYRPKPQRRTCSRPQNGQTLTLSRSQWFV